MSSRYGAGHGHEGRRTGEEPRVRSVSRRRERIIKTALAGCESMLARQARRAGYQRGRTLARVRTWVNVLEGEQPAGCSLPYLQR